LLVLASAGVGTAFADSSDKATGGIKIVSANDFDAARMFTAQGTPASAKGEVETRVVDPVTGDLVRQWHGVVDCYQAIDSKTARFSGYVTNSQGGEDVEGQYFRWTVRDNGEGSNAPPDEFVAARFANKPASTCTSGGQPTLEAVKGNLQVKNK
jgi:hypothetical protein